MLTTCRPPQEHIGEHTAWGSTREMKGGPRRERQHFDVRKWGHKYKGCFRNPKNQARTNGHRLRSMSSGLRFVAELNLLLLTFPRFRILQTWDGGPVPASSPESPEFGGWGWMEPGRKHPTNSTPPLAVSPGLSYLPPSQPGALLVFFRFALPPTLPLRRSKQSWAGISAGCGV